MSSRANRRQPPLNSAKAAIDDGDSDASESARIQGCSERRAHGGDCYERGNRDAAFDRPLVWNFPNFWGPLQRPGPVEGPGLGPSSTIRRGDWKLIYYHTDQRFELFELAGDLGEKNNLADHEPQRVRELARELTDILKKFDAPMPVVAATGRPVPLPAEVLKP